MDSCNTQLKGGREEGGMDGQRCRSVNSQNQYTDDHQLFIGNLPLINATENDLKPIVYPDEIGTIVNVEEKKFKHRSEGGGRGGMQGSIPHGGQQGGREEGGMDGERRRSVNSQNQYTDDHQLFIGNLPRNATENDLKELFETFGTVVDLQIIYKPNNGTKGSNGSKLPNYGFIIFESTQAAQACLNARPIVYPDEIGTKVNIQGKKFKHRSEGGGRGSMQGSMPRGGQ